MFSNVYWYVLITLGLTSFKGIFCFTHLKILVSSSGFNRQIFLDVIPYILHSAVLLPGNILPRFGIGIRDFIGIGTGSGTVHKQWPVPKPED